MSPIRRGEIFLVDFDPAKPNEVARKRPAIVVSNNVANQHGTTVMVVPLSSDSSRVYPFQLLLPSEETGLKYESKAQVEQMRAVSKVRLGAKLGVVPPELMKQVERRILLHLGIE